MKYFPIIGCMDSPMLEKFLDFANSSKDDPWIIVLNTVGGSYFATEAIAHIINLHNDVKIMVQGAYSSGFILLMKTKCKKILSKTCRGMWHYGKWSIEYNDKQKPYYYEDECIIRNMSLHKRETETLAKNVMTTKELKDFMADKDVYFDSKRMREIFPDAEIMK